MVEINRSIWCRRWIDVPLDLSTTNTEKDEPLDYSMKRRNSDGNSSNSSENHQSNDQNQRVRQILTQGHNPVQHWNSSNSSENHQSNDQIQRVGQILTQGHNPVQHWNSSNSSENHQLNNQIQRVPQTLTLNHNPASNTSSVQHWNSSISSENHQLNNQIQRIPQTLIQNHNPATYTSSVHETNTLVSGTHSYINFTPPPVYPPGWFGMQNSMQIHKSNPIPSANITPDLSPQSVIYSPVTLSINVSPPRIPHTILTPHSSPNFSLMPMNSREKIPQIKLDPRERPFKVIPDKVIFPNGVQSNIKHETRVEGAQRKITQNITSSTENTMLRGAKYYEHRKRNNEAARRSRNKRKMKEDAISNRLNSVKNDNEEIKRREREIEQRIVNLKQQIAEVRPDLANSIAIPEPVTYSLEEVFYNETELRNIPFRGRARVKPRKTSTSSSANTSTSSSKSISTSVIQYNFGRDHSPTSSTENSTKGSRYIELRMRNNKAARRSRDARRQREDDKSQLLVAQINEFELRKDRLSKLEQILTDLLNYNIVQI